MHRRKQHPARHILIGARAQKDMAAARLELRQLAVGDMHPSKILWIDRYARLGLMSEEAGNRSGAAHGMPLVAQPACSEAQRVALVHLLRNRPIRRRDKARAAGWRGKDAVLVQALSGMRRVFRKWPLLRPAFVEQRV